MVSSCLMGGLVFSRCFFLAKCRSSDPTGSLAWAGSREGLSSCYEGSVVGLEGGLQPRCVKPIDVPLGPPRKSKTVSPAQEVIATWPQLLLPPPHAAWAACRTHVRDMISKPVVAHPWRPTVGPVMGSHATPATIRLHNNSGLGAAFPAMPCAPVVGRAWCRAEATTGFWKA